MVTSHIQSPLSWIGGKAYSARRIIQAFPPLYDYDVYVDLFGGAAHVLLEKPVIKKHTEVFNDINSDLVNFWMHCRDDAQRFQARLSSLPYSRALYYQYHKSLYSGEALDSMERAVRWFYVIRSSFTGRERESSAPGWSGSALKNDAHAYRSALELFMPLQQRLKHVLIDHRDFEKVFQSYNHPRVLFYCDPPYIGVEQYYRHPFTMADHERLAHLLNDSPALIALSYYPHPILDRWYPIAKWHRITWMMAKHSQRTKEHHEQATELLLCNYAPARGSLWDDMITA
jgi:DNA adenine methylase